MGRFAIIVVLIILIVGIVCSIITLSNQIHANGRVRAAAFSESESEMAADIFIEENNSNVNIYYNYY